MKGNKRLVIGDRSQEEEEEEEGEQDIAEADGREIRRWKRKC